MGDIFRLLSVGILALITELLLTLIFIYATLSSPRMCDSRCVGMSPPLGVGRASARMAHCDELHLDSRRAINGLNGWR